jgi:hypothetical protein
MMLMSKTPIPIATLMPVEIPVEIPVDEGEFGFEEGGLGEGGIEEF